MYGGGAVRGRSWNQMEDPLLFSLAVLTILGTPGPTNTLLATSGGAVGVKASLPLVPAEAAGYLIAIVAIGLALGAVVSAALARLLSGMVYGVSLADPLTLLIVPALLGGVALAASLVPARRAAATSPADVLK